MFNQSNFTGSNILLIDPKNYRKNAFISTIKDSDAVVIDNAEELSNNEFKDAVKQAGYRQIIVGLNSSNTSNVCLIDYDYLVVFNNKHQGWREDIYYKFSMHQACDDFNEFADVLDKLEEGECIVVSTDEGTIRRLSIN